MVPASGMPSSRAPGADNGRVEGRHQGHAEEVAAKGLQGSRADCARHRQGDAHAALHPTSDLRAVREQEDEAEGSHGEEEDER